MDTRIKNILTYLLIAGVYFSYIMNFGFYLATYVFHSSEETPMWTMEQAVGWLSFLLLFSFLFFSMIYSVWMLGKRDKNFNRKDKKYIDKDKIFKKAKKPSNR